MQAGILLLTFATIASATVFSENKIIHCSNNIFCDRSLKYAKEHSPYKKNLIARILELPNITSDDQVYYLDNNISNVINDRSHFCREESWVGFVLDQDYINYTSSCVWSGNDGTVSCAPVPPEYTEDPFYFIRPNEWKQKLLAFRLAIQCPREDIERLEKQTSELYICNERCIQAGIGYLPSLIMLMSFSIAFIRAFLM